MIKRLHDTHFHLDLQRNRTAAIQHIEDSQIYTIAVTNLPDLYRRESVEIASKFIRIALGFHPELIHQYKEQIPLMWDLLPNVRYIGEVGLDFVDVSFQGEQISFFSELIERCRNDKDKIVTIHSRRAIKKVIEIIGKDYKFKPILHWFSGNKAELYAAIDADFFFSVNNAMLSSHRFLEMLPMIPANRLLVETDSPFINYEISHVFTLNSIVSSINEYRPDIDISANFESLLTNKKACVGPDLDRI